MVLALHRAGHRSDPRRGLQPHGRRQRRRPDAQLQGAGEPRLLHARKRRPALPQLLRLRQHAQRQPPDRPRADLPLPALLGPQLPRRRLPLRSGLDPQPRPRGRTWCPIRRWSSRSPKTRCWPTPRSSPRPGTPPAPTRWAPSASLRWAEWNGRYRDDVRRFWRGDPHMVGTAGHAPGRLQRPLPARRPPPLPQHQLHHLPRRLHAQRPGQLQREAQRGQRREQPRRREQQLQLQLRRRRARPGAATSSASACGRSRTCWPRCC